MGERETRDWMGEAANAHPWNRKTAAPPEPYRGTAHKKQPLPRTLQFAHAYGPIVFLKGEVVSYGRGTPASLNPPTPSARPFPGAGAPPSSGVGASGLGKGEKLRTARHAQPFVGVFQRSI